MSELRLLSLEAIEQWGEEAQIGMIHEEIGELMQALNKWRRDPNKVTHDQICEEIADVEIMLDQLMAIVDNNQPYDTDETVINWMVKKMERLEARLNAYKPVLEEEKGVES